MPQPSPILSPPDGPASVPQPRRAGPALYMLVAVALFALMDTGLKILSPHYPALQVATLRGARSEEHTSELQSLMRISYAVFCLKKNKPQSRSSVSRPTRQST